MKPFKPKTLGFPKNSWKNSHKLHILLIIGQDNIMKIHSLSWALPRHTMRPRAGANLHPINQFHKNKRSKLKAKLKRSIAIRK